MVLLNLKIYRLDLLDTHLVFSQGSVSGRRFLLKPFARQLVAGGQWLVRRLTNRTGPSKRFLKPPKSSPIRLRNGITTLWQAPDWWKIEEQEIVLAVHFDPASHISMRLVEYKFVMQNFSKSTKDVRFGQKVNLGRITNLQFVNRNPISSCSLYAHIVCTHKRVQGFGSHLH